MFTAEIWVAISFALFFLFFGKKIFSMIRGVSDGYIREVKSKIQQAEDLKSEAENFLKEALQKKEKVQSTIERYESESKHAMENLRAQSKKDLNAFIRKTETAFRDGLKAEFNKKVENIHEKIIDDFASSLRNKIQNSQSTCSITADDLRKFKERL